MAKDLSIGGAQFLNCTKLRFWKQKQNSSIQIPGVMLSIGLDNRQDIYIYIARIIPLQGITMTRQNGLEFLEMLWKAITFRHDVTESTEFCKHQIHD